MSTTDRSGARRVLVVEDDRLVARVIQRGLVSLGCEVGLATDGAEAVEKSIEESFDMILMDWQLPTVDGLDATRRIREQGVAIPIVGMSADCEPELAHEAGQNGSLAKGASLEELASTLDRFAPTRRAKGARVLDDTLPSSVGDAPELLGELTQIFLEDVRKRVDQLVSALEQADRAQMRRCAHAMRGASAAFGASRVRALAERVEHAIAEGNDAEISSLAAALPAAVSEVERAARLRGWLP